MHIAPNPLSGRLPIMPSKSASHRALLCAALAQGESAISPLQRSNDVLATMGCLKGLGLINHAPFSPLPGMTGFHTCTLSGGHSPVPAPLRVLDCGESGSTLRFILPLALDGAGPVRLLGHGLLLERPLGPYEDIIARQGLGFAREAGALVVSGKLTSGTFTLPGDVSSQFITGLLYALPRLKGDSVIHIQGRLESRGYVDLTLDALKSAGIRAWFEDESTLLVPGGQVFCPGQYRVEGDWSHAAFYLVAGALMGEGITLEGLDPASAQGDRAVVDHLKAMGADISWVAGALAVKPRGLKGIDIDVTHTPDLVPALAVAACGAMGRTRITGAARVRLKECDRLAAMAQELGKLGACIQETPEGLIIEGGASLHHGGVMGHNDHRIAMAMAICAPLCQGGVDLEGAHAVAKSAPRFFEEFTQLGGSIHEGPMGH